MGLEETTLGAPLLCWAVCHGQTLWLGGEGPKFPPTLIHGSSLCLSALSLSAYSQTLKKDVDLACQTGECVRAALRMAPEMGMNRGPPSPPMGCSDGFWLWGQAALS